MSGRHGPLPTQRCGDLGSTGDGLSRTAGSEGGGVAWRVSSVAASHDQQLGEVVSELEKMAMKVEVATRSMWNGRGRATAQRPD
jgi:hypothetical protein